ncbi:glutamate--tRNA ligase [Marinibaculum pumilum]|uniref:Glutamate--tRNA ligase n=1 Tax=Marinibaculum pumilum TaxID=1766165 RepID=A0ABV7L3T4_9PROT
MSVRTRFAPSPTGLLHVGNAKLALVNWLFARQQGGRFLLRLDDTDTERSTPEFAAAIERDLDWLGLRWDERIRQSDRHHLYAAAVARLQADGRLYPCYETPEELERRRRLQRARGAPPVYDRAALKLDAGQRAALEAEGRVPHWRFRLSDGRIGWTDLVRGPVEIDLGSLSDPVLLRADGRPLFTLTAVVDDIETGMTHVVRGEDHVANTAAHVDIFAALGAVPPDFAHLALLVGADGAPLSKRLGGLSLAGLREEGIEPAAVTALLARLGSADPVEPVADLAPLVAGFAFDRLGRAPARFDPAELRALNAQIVHELPFDAVADRLPAGADAAFWEAVRGNLERVADAADWWAVIHQPLDPVIEDAAVTAAAAALLPQGEPAEADWGPWTKAVAAQTGAKGRTLFMPLRLALTGRPHGPELKKVLPLIGRERALARLQGRRA